MTDKPFNYDDCKPHRDGKRRAVDHAGQIYVLLCDDAPGTYPIKGYNSDGDSRCWTKKGWWVVEGPTRAFDLVGPAPEAPREWWHNHYHDDVVLVFDTREEADNNAGTSRIECINVVEKRS